MDAFELVTAMYAADGHELRRDWFGKEDQPGRQHRLAVTMRPAGQEVGIIAGVSNTDFLQTISLFHTRDRRIKVANEGREPPPISVDRAALLNLPLAAYLKYQDKAAAPISRSGVRRALSKLRGQVRDALHEASFVFDPKDDHAQHSQIEDRYTVWHLPNASFTGAGSGLRPEIQLEMTYSPMRLPAVMHPVRSFVTEAIKRPPDIANIACVSLNETAAEKLVALTRRTVMDLTGLTRGEADPTLVRHIYDLHVMRDLVDSATVAGLATDIAKRMRSNFGTNIPRMPTT